jgi:hypothetical protein
MGDNIIIILTSFQLVHSHRVLFLLLFLFLELRFFVDQEAVSSVLDMISGNFIHSMESVEGRVPMTVMRLTLRFSGFAIKSCS